MLFSRRFPESAFNSRHQPSHRFTKGHKADSACDTQHVLVPAIGLQSERQGARVSWLLSKATASEGNKLCALCVASPTALCGPPAEARASTALLDPSYWLTRRSIGFLRLDKGSSALSCQWR